MYANWITLLYTWNIVKQLYVNLKNNKIKYFAETSIKKSEIKRISRKMIKENLNITALHQD